MVGKQKRPRSIELAKQDESSVVLATEEATTPTPQRRRYKTPYIALSFGISKVETELKWHVVVVYPHETSEAF